MAVSLAAGFKVNNNEPIDTRLVLTKAQMKAMRSAGMPLHYFALCSEDNNFYVYDSSNDEDETTGKFKLYSSGSSYTAGSGIDLTDDKITVKVDSAWVVIGTDNKLTVSDDVSTTINAWKVVAAPPTATDNVSYIYKNNSWQALPELSDTVISATNAQGKTELRSVVSLSINDDGLLNFNNGKLV